MKNKLRKLIREEINNLFESLGFQSSAAEQIATNMALFKIPRKGIDDSINYYNQIQSYLDKNEPEEEKEEEIKNNFEVPDFNNPNAATRTNIYESEGIEESCGIYGSTEAAKKNLDREIKPSPKTANFGKESQEEFELRNDNINQELTYIPPGESRKDGVSNNKSKNF
jgi:hypothetical protein